MIARTSRTVALLLAGTLALAACSGDDRDVAVEAPVARPAPLPEPVPMPPDVEPGLPGGQPIDGDDVTPEYVEVSPDAVDAVLRDWSEVFVVDGGEAIELRWWGGVEPCHVVKDVTVEYDEDLVTVGLLVGRAPSDEPVACIEIARYTAVRVPLAEPVGSRSIVDASEL